MKSVVLVTGNHLCNNPRAIKEAKALAAAGYSVEILGAWFDARLRARDQAMLSHLPCVFSPVMDVAGRGASLQSRVRTKVGQWAHRIAGWQNRWQLGAMVTALGDAAKARKADLYIAHSEAALVAVNILRQSGRRVGVDFEDWFSEDLLPEARRHRPLALLGKLERSLLRQGAYASCPSHAMSEALSREHGCPSPTVIYNAFPWTDRSAIDGASRDRRDRAVPSIHWYSQTLGQGRGLEDLLVALNHVPHAAELHLRGQPAAGFDGWFARLVPHRWRDRVFVHGVVPNDELLSRISEHDVGFAGEMKYCRNKDLTISNKMLHYLLAGLAVIASDTSGQQEVARKAPTAVALYPSGDAVALAARINALLESNERLRLAKAAALRAAEEDFCWERQESRLLDSIALALDGATQRTRTQ